MTPEIRVPLHNAEVHIDLRAGLDEDGGVAGVVDVHTGAHRSWRKESETYIEGGID